MEGGGCWSCGRSSGDVAALEMVAADAAMESSSEYIAHTLSFEALQVGQGDASKQTTVKSYLLERWRNNALLRLGVAAAAALEEEGGDC